MKAISTCKMLLTRLLMELRMNTVGLRTDSLS